MYTSLTSSVLLLLSFMVALCRPCITSIWAECSWGLESEYTIQVLALAHDGHAAVAWISAYGSDSLYYQYSQNSALTSWSAPIKVVSDRVFSRFQLLLIDERPALLYHDNPDHYDPDDDGHLHLVKANDTLGSVWLLDEQYDFVKDIGDGVFYLYGLSHRESGNAATTVSVLYTRADSFVLAHSEDSGLTWTYSDFLFAAGRYNHGHNSAVSRSIFVIGSWRTVLNSTLAFVGGASDQSILMMRIDGHGAETTFYATETITSQPVLLSRFFYVGVNTNGLPFVLYAKNSGIEGDDDYTLCVSNCNSTGGDWTETEILHGVNKDHPLLSYIGKQRNYITNADGTVTAYIRTTDHGRKTVFTEDPDSVEWQVVNTTIGCCGGGEAVVGGLAVWSVCKRGLGKVELYRAYDTKSSHFTGYCQPTAAPTARPTAHPIPPSIAPTTRATPIPTPRGGLSQHTPEPTPYPTDVVVFTDRRNDRGTGLISSSSSNGGDQATVGPSELGGVQVFGIVMSVLFVAAMVIVAFFIRFEEKLKARFQHRVGGGGTQLGELAEQGVVTTHNGAQSVVVASSSTNTSSASPPRVAATGDTTVLGTQGSLPIGS